MRTANPISISAMAMQVGLPPLLGMLIVGIILVNIPQGELG